ncbi:hypothetical protein B0H10DRAFT_2072448 [Mycena sp. CBHHK59/15]|nr:hypothetical protein B0H10DRAFT_2072448 [Mycena sp. CBHHK59/15]
MIGPDIPAPHPSLVAASFKSHFWPSPLPSICTMPKTRQPFKATAALTLKRSQTSTPIPDDLAQISSELDSPAQTSSELDMEANVKRCLDEVPQLFILRFSNRAARFVSAYYLGCNGKDLGYLQKTYKSHRMLPYDAVTLMKESVHM